MSVFIELIVDDHPRGAGSLLWENPTQRSNLLLLPNSLDHARHHPRQHPFWSDLWWVSLQECGQSMPAWGGTDKLMLFSPLFVSLIPLILLPSPISLPFSHLNFSPSVFSILPDLTHLFSQTNWSSSLSSHVFGSWFASVFALSPLFCFSLSLYMECSPGNWTENLC